MKSQSVVFLCLLSFFVLRFRTAGCGEEGPFKEETEGEQDACGEWSNSPFHR